MDTHSQLDLIERRQSEYPKYPYDESVSGWRVHDADPDRTVWVVPLLFTAAIITGPTGTPFYTDRWCYGSVEAAIDAAQAWITAGMTGEPVGWHRHPNTGRRRADGREWIER